MSYLSDAAEEAMKPIKIGVYIGAAVLTTGVLILAANSGPGRTLLSKIKNGLTSNKVAKNQIEEKKELEVANKDTKKITSEPEMVQQDEVKLIPLTKGSSNV